MNEETFLIGVLAKRTNTKVETIRYYEHEGLIADPPRTSGGYRVYNRNHLKRLGFIRRSRELGFTLEQVRELLRFVDGRGFTCGEVQSVALGHLDEIRRKITDLEKVATVLVEMSDRCDGGQIPDCPIVDALFGDGV